MSARPEAHPPKRGSYCGWLAKVKSEDAKAKWLATTGMRYFTIDFDNQVFFYKHDKHGKRASELVCFKDILGATVAVPENPKPKTPSRLRRSFSGSSLSRALVGAETRLECSFFVHIRHKRLRLIAKSSVVAVWWVDMLNAACMIGMNLQGLEATSRGTLPSNFACFPTLEQPSRNEIPSDLMSQASHTTADYSVQSVSAHSIADSSEADASNPFNEAIAEQASDSCEKETTSPDANPHREGAVAEKDENLCANMPREESAVQKDANQCKNEVVFQDACIQEVPANRSADQLDNVATSRFESAIDSVTNKVSPEANLDLVADVDSTSDAGVVKQAPIEAQARPAEDNASKAVLGAPCADDLGAVEAPHLAANAACNNASLVPDQNVSALEGSPVTVWRYATLSGRTRETSSNPKHQRKQRAHSHAGNRIVGPARMSAEDRVAADMALVRQTNFKKHAASDSAEARMAVDMALLQKPGINPHGRLKIASIGNTELG